MLDEAVEVECASGGDTTSGFRIFMRYAARKGMDKNKNKKVIAKTQEWV